VDRRTKENYNEIADMKERQLKDDYYKYMIETI
jgi:hypothetical protein